MPNLKIYAIIDGNGVVKNMAVWDEIESWDPGQGLTKLDVTSRNDVGIGYTTNDGGTTFTPPQ